jgi:hypothetical protein
MKNLVFILLLIISLNTSAHEESTGSGDQKDLNLEKSEKMHKQLRGEIITEKKESKCSNDDEVCLKNEFVAEKKLVEEKLKGTP